MRYELPDGTIVASGMPCAFDSGHGLVSYPANWLMTATDEELNRLGVKTLPDLPVTPRPGRIHDGHGHA